MKRNIKLRGLFAAVILFSLWVLTACGQQAAGAPEIPEAPAERTEPVEAAGEEMAEEAEEPAVKTEFTKEELLADYDQIWEILEENYPFLPVLEEHGVDWQQLRTDYRQTLSGRAASLEHFAATVRQMFLQMENFAHLFLVDKEDLQLYEALPPDESRYFEPWYETVTAPQTQASYAQLSNETDTGTAADTAYPEVETAYYPDCKAAYFHFRTFNYFVTERDSTVVADYLATLPEVEHIILDITGNNGGNYGYVTNNIIAPLSSGEISWDDYVLFAKSAVNERFFLRNGVFEAHPLSELPEDAAYPEFAEQLGLTHYAVVPTVRVAGENSAAASAKRWLLVDGLVFSSSETFARFCKETGWATLVGTRTLGDGDGLNPVLVPLDNTGLLIKFSSITCANSDGSLNAEAGAIPDYPCKKNELPLSKCLALIRNGQ